MDTSTQKSRLRLLIFVYVIVAIFNLLILFGLARLFHWSLGLTLMMAAIFLVIYASAAARGAVRGLRKRTP